MALVLYTLIGFIVGVLINILADDLPARHRPQLPHCEACQTRYRPLHWSGLLRRLVARARCPSCDAAETWRPALIELGMAAVFALMWLRYRHLSAELVIYSAYLAIFALILVTDLEHRLILHVVTFPSILLALIAGWLTVTPLSAVVGAAIGFGFFFLVYLLGGLAFGAGAMGFGDVTLATLIGATVGFPMVIVALLVGVLTGGVVTGGLLITRLRRMRSKVPYGPFLLVGGVVALLWGRQIIAWYLR